MLQDLCLLLILFSHLNCNCIEEIGIESKQTKLLLFTQGDSWSITMNRYRHDESVWRERESTAAAVTQGNCLQVWTLDMWLQQTLSPSTSTFRWWIGTLLMVCLHSNYHLSPNDEKTCLACSNSSTSASSSEGCRAVWRGTAAEVWLHMREPSPYSEQ